MIKSFDCKETAKVFAGQSAPKFGNLCGQCHKRLVLLNAATTLNDLRAFPGNRLEPLKHTMPGFYSIRVNDRWRVIFMFNPPDAYRVAIVDYH